MHEMMKIDSARIRKLREERSWSQEQLATVSGLSLRTVQRVESEGAASLETRAALASVFSVTPLSLAATTGSSSRGPFPGKSLGIVCGIGGVWLGFIYASCAAIGSDGFYGKLGSWVGLSCSVAGILAGAYWRPGWLNSGRSGR